MPLDNFDPTDDFLEVETKLDAIVDELNNNQIKWAEVNIGDWDMDSTSAVSVNHGIADHTKIRVVNVMIRPDNAEGSGNFLLNHINASTGVGQGGVSTIGATTITLVRLTGGTFDSTVYNATSYNRGFITIGYRE